MKATAGRMRRPSIEDKERGLRIMAARLEHGLSQQALADAVGVDRTTVTHWESGRISLTAANAIALAALLGTTAEQLVGPPRPARQEPTGRAPNPSIAPGGREGGAGMAATDAGLQQRVEMLEATCRDLLVRMVRAEDELIRARGAAGEGRDAAPKQA